MISEIVIKFKTPQAEHWALYWAALALAALDRKESLPEEIEDVQLGTNVAPGEFLPPTIKHPDAI